MDLGNALMILKAASLKNGRSDRGFLLMAAPLNTYSRFSQSEVPVADNPVLMLHQMIDARIAFAQAEALDWDEFSDKQSPTEEAIASLSSIGGIFALGLGCVLAIISVASFF
jgi:hypothetical protein